MTAKAKKKTVRIQNYRSPIGYNKKQREVLRGLGIRRLNQIVEREATPEILGMVDKIPHLVRVVEEDK